MLEFEHNLKEQGKWMETVMATQNTKFIDRLKVTLPAVSHEIKISSRSPVRPFVNFQLEMHHYRQAKDILSRSQQAPILFVQAHEQQATSLLTEVQQLMHAIMVITT